VGTTFYEAAHHTATGPSTVGHREVEAEDFSVESGHNELG